MWAAVYFAMLVLHHGSLCTQTVARTDSYQSKELQPLCSSGPEHRSDAVLLKAKMAFERAVRLSNKQNAKDLFAAADSFRASAEFFSAAGSDGQAAEAYLQAGDIYSTLSRYQKARTAYSEAVRTQYPEMRCKALSRIARTYATTGPFSLADQYSKQALDLCRELSEPAQAEALEARGEVLLEFSGERAQGENFFRQARELFVRGGDRNGEARTLLALAHIGLFSDGRQAEGLRSAEQALQLWSSTGNQYGIARMRSYLGTFAITKGQFEIAQCNYRLSRQVFQLLGNKDEEASVLNGLGYVNRETGERQKSLQYYRQARAIFASVHDMVGEMEAIRGVGKALSMAGDYKSLLPLYRQNLRLARRSGDTVAIAGSLADLAHAYEATRQYSQAELSYRRALKEYRAVHHVYGEADVLVALGRVKITVGRYSEAISFLESANVLQQQLGEIEGVAEVQYELAIAYLRLNRFERAESAIETTIDIIEKQRMSISHFDSRASYFAVVHAYYAIYIEILMSLEKEQPGRGFAEKAFNASERSRARTLLDLLTTSSQDVSCKELLESQLHPISQTEVATAAEAGSPSPTLTLKEVQAEIEPEDTVLLEYALGDTKSYVWAVENDQISAHELPQSQRIRRLVEGFRQMLVPSQLKAGENASDYQARVRMQDQSYRAYARQLSKILLGPVKLAGAKRVLIVPDGSLHYVPFAALLIPVAGSDEQLLIRRYEVNVLPSASVLGTLRKTALNRAPPTATAAIFADPVFEADDPRIPINRGKASGLEERPAALTRAIRDIGGPQYIPRLEGSREEANAIANVLDSWGSQRVQVSLDFAASRNFVLKDGLTRFRLVHFATHGLIDSRRPEMSGLILSLIDSRGRKQDGYLRLQEIYKMKLTADLVVLSSCESGLGKDLPAEGIIGLPRGFLYAGAKTVIASLWKVDDEATAKLMTALYARIRRGESPSSALRGAQLQMTRDEQWSKPYYWAAFSLEGEYR
jgi:CHAT domain-containing protein/Flp pilus assembly protein TadD